MRSLRVETNSVHYCSSSVVFPQWRAAGERLFLDVPSRTCASPIALPLSIMHIKTAAYGTCRVQSKYYYPDTGLDIGLLATAQPF